MAEFENIYEGPLGSVFHCQNSLMQENNKKSMKAAGLRANLKLEFCLRSSQAPFCFVPLGIMNEVIL